MFTEDDLLPISALQHLVFCERQWALIHLEQLWSENALTAQGRVMHDRVHEENVESRGDLKLARSLAIRSLTLGLIGQGRSRRISSPAGKRSTRHGPAKLQWSLAASAGGIQTRQTQNRPLRRNSTLCPSPLPRRNAPCRDSRRSSFLWPAQTPNRCHL